MSIALSGYRAIIFGAIVLLGVADQAVGANRTFDITARNWTFDISPTPFTVNQGDMVTLRITASVPENNAHGFIMETYVSNRTLNPGVVNTISFTAHTAGSFDFQCTRSACGVGHSSMNGVMTVIATPVALALNSVSPSTGSSNGGSAVSLSGTGFDPGATVTFGGTNATSVSVMGSTTINAVTPAHSAGAVTVVVNSGGDTASKANAFTFVTPPTLSSIQPASGPASGGTPVTLQGGGFVSGASVTLGGTAASNVSVSSSSTITATTPSRAAGTVNVVVRNPDSQTTTLPSAFTFVAGPSVSSVSPSSGPPAGGTRVTISGGGFQSGATATFGGSSATNVTFNSASSMMATTPAHAAGSVTVVVSNPDGQTGSRANGFTYETVAGPSVSSVSPSSGPPAGGTRVTISGAGFQSGATATFGGSPATNVTFSSASSLMVTTPAHAAGPVTVVVSNPDGQTGSRASGFTYETALAFSSIAPTTGSSAGGTAVTLTGGGFESGATLSLGGIAALNVVVASATTITALTPPHEPAIVSVEIRNPDGRTATLPNAFTFATFAAGSISPVSGPAQGGTPFTLTGSGFIAGASVSFDGLAATSLIVVSATSITGVTPSHAAGTVDVVVTNPDSQQTTLLAGFTFTGRRRAVRRD